MPAQAHEVWESRSGIYPVPVESFDDRGTSFAQYPVVQEAADFPILSE
jgi:hypothetical protein